VAQVVLDLPSKGKALSSSFSTTKKNASITLYSYTKTFSFFVSLFYTLFSILTLFISTSKVFCCRHLWFRAWDAEVGGSLEPEVQDQPGQHSETLAQKNRTKATTNQKKNKKGFGYKLRHRHIWVRVIHVSSSPPHPAWLAAPREQ
jgi:hypothetical protein